MKPRLLDLMCGEGGCSMGYSDGGWLVAGVDIEDRGRYPFPFRWDDAFNVLWRLLDGEALGFGDRMYGLEDFAGIHASPPCQKFSKAQRLQGNEHVDLITPIRPLLDVTGLPYVIENVESARPWLRNPTMLCGTMFGLPLYRHRLFETNWPLDAPLHGEHFLKQTKMGRAPKDGEIMQPVGNFAGVERARRDLETPWMSRDGMRECVPPAYCRYIGERMLEHIESKERAAA